MGLDVLVSAFTLEPEAGGSRATIEMTRHLDAELTYLIAKSPPADEPIGLSTVHGGRPRLLVNPVRPKAHIRLGTASFAQLWDRNRDLLCDQRWLGRQAQIADGCGADLTCSMTTLMPRADVFFVHFLRARTIAENYGFDLDPRNRLIRLLDLKERRMLAIERQNLRPQNHRLLVVPSHATKQAVQAYYDVPDERIVVVHNGVDPGEYTLADPAARWHARARLGIDPDEPTVLFVGRSPERKGIETLIAAADDAGAPLRLLLAGFEPNRLVERALARHRVRADVLGVVDHEQLQRYYHAADLLVLPSIVEPFGLVALEAMASGLPAAVSDATGVAEVIRHGRTGFVLSHQHIRHELADLLASVAARELDLSGIGLAARRDTELRLSWRRHAAILQSTLEDLASTRRHVTEPGALAH